ncbi:MAG: hypothetical protein QW607_05770 [Desulfurococcaceae archaeon]
MVTVRELKEKVFTIREKELEVLTTNKYGIVEFCVKLKDTVMIDNTILFESIAEKYFSTSEFTDKEKRNKIIEQINSMKTNAQDYLSAIVNICESTAIEKISFKRI